MKWKIAGTGDYNGDGRADILFHHSENGKVSMWTMKGATIQTATVITIIGDLDWQVVGSGDYNGDGRSDILWRHNTTGKVTMWFMNGSTIGSTAVVWASAADLDWTPQNLP